MAILARRLKAQRNRQRFMPGRARVEFPGAVYHLPDRGDRQEEIFRTDSDRELFLATLGQACGRCDWRVHAWVLMTNHYDCARARSLSLRPWKARPRLRLRYGRLCRGSPARRASERVRAGSMLGTTSSFPGFLL